MLAKMGGSHSVDLTKTEVPQINCLLDDDSYLKPYESEIRRRYGSFLQVLSDIEKNEGGLDQFTRSYERYGLHVDEKNNIHMVEWAPGAKNVYLRGDFSNILL